MLTNREKRKGGGSIFNGRLYLFYFTYLEGVITGREEENTSFQGKKKTF